jgi:hypothetical protein
VLVEFGSGGISQCVEQTSCQKNNTMTPFLLTGNDNVCVSSCPPGTSPLLQNYNNLVCSSSLSTPEPISIDASVYTVSYTPGSTQKIFYFVINKLLKESDVKVNYYSKNDNHPKIGASSTSLGQLQSSMNLAQFNNKSYIGIKTTADEVILDFSPNIEQISSGGGNRLASTVYGVSSDSDHIQNSKFWLAIIAYVLSLLLICLHAIYVGNELIYKVDNWLILAQTMYFFSFVQLLINMPIGQFYYGFLFAHFGFFPNYFKGTIPDNYMEGYYDISHSNVPNSFKLLTGDANFIRNAGFSFSLLATFIVAYIVVICVIWILKKCCGFYEIWYKRIAWTAIIGAF